LILFIGEKGGYMLLEKVAVFVGICEKERWGLEVMNCVVDEES
jgi:hypothetical protein